MEKRGYVFLMIICLIITILIISNLFKKNFIIGKSFYEESGLIKIIIYPALKIIYILSPLNTTYYFGIGENYIIDLNVSSNYELFDTWWYKLEDLRHNLTVKENVFFIPNSTIEAVRWNNKLTVYANDSKGESASASVIFYVEVPNSAPLLGYIPDELFGCEGGWISYKFNATDIDEDLLEFSINPRNPIFIWNYGKVNWTTTMGEIFSVYIYKSRVGFYQTTVYATDGQYTDSKEVNITLIEINNPPEVEEIGVQTVWTRGENSTFYKEVQVNDVESGNQTSGNFAFNLTFLNSPPLFNISRYGIMNFTPNSSHVGVYNLSLCVTDQALSNPHPNITLCSQNGSNQTVCQNFSLTITDENRKPTITSYYPLNLSFNASGISRLFFNITKYDPDGTIPDARWYVDNNLVQYNSGSSVDNFTYSFGCGIWGVHNVRVEITDGLLTDSLTWVINVQYVPCPEEIEIKEIPLGAIGEVKCVPKWACTHWEVCQNIKKSLELGLIVGEDYRRVMIECGNNYLREENCGYQIRKCFDVNNCNSTMSKPSELQYCYYTEKPSCFDGIKNCHSGSCEVLIDCGGPCKPCPTCTDGIQNQGETGIDCGGPCPWRCPIELPSRVYMLQFLKHLLILLIILLIILIIAKLAKLRKIKKEIKKYEK